jgi:hypothetical protein
MSSLCGGTVIGGGLALGDVVGDVSVGGFIGGCVVGGVLSVDDVGGDMSGGGISLG